MMSRKELAQAIAAHFGAEVKYLGVPSFAYEIKTAEETFTVNREGKIITQAGDEMVLEEILNPADKIDGVEVSFPLEGHTGTSLRNLVHMIYSRQHLIKKAFMQEGNILEMELITRLAEAGKEVNTVDNFKIAIAETSHPGIILDDEKITFKFYNRDISPEKTEAYIQFLTVLIKTSKELKYASAKVAQTDNEKYAFRTWLVRLGMVGGEYKKARKILLENLSGNGAFRRNTDTLIEEQ